MEGGSRGGWARVASATAARRRGDVGGGVVCRARTRRPIREALRPARHGSLFYAAHRCLGIRGPTEPADHHQPRESSKRR